METNKPTGDFDKDTIGQFRDALEGSLVDAAIVTVVAKMGKVHSDIPLPISVICESLQKLGMAIGLVLLFVERRLKADLNDNPKLADMTLNDYFIKSVRRS